MTIPLNKGNNINLSKDHPFLRNVTVGLGWDIRSTDHESFDLDASVLMVGLDGKARSDRDFIYYHQKNSLCGSIHHNGDNTNGEGEGDDETINVILGKVPVEIQRLIICVSIHDAGKKKQNFGQVANAFIRLVNKDTGEEIARYDLSENASRDDAIIFAEIYRYEADWKFKAIGQGFIGGLAEFVRSHGLSGSSS
jgi:tellurium resistance protein TerD